MKSKLLANEYLSVASAFAGQDPVEAIRCVCRALQLDAAALPQARELVATALSSTAPSNSDGASTDLRRLRRRQEKLDALCHQEAQIANSADQLTPTDLIRETGPCQDAPSGEFLRRLALLDKMLRDEQGSQYDPARCQVREMLDAHGAAGDVPPGCDVGAGFDEWGWLGIEHHLHNAGNDCYRAGRFDQALAFYEAVLRINPELLESEFNRALAAFKCAQYDTAEEALNKVIRMNPDLPETYYTRAMVFDNKGQDRKALDDVDKALEIDRDYEKARTYRQQLLEKMAGKSSSSPDHRSSDDGHITDFTPYVTRPNYTLDDAGGHHRIKRILTKILMYLKGNPALEDWGAELPRGVLMHGIPGVGKSHLARCLAGEASVPFYATPSSIFANVWAGSEEKSLHRLFEQASEHDGAIVFIDEFDTVGCKRISAKHQASWHNGAVNCLLELMDGLQERKSNLVVIAATNKIRNVSKAFLRPGRFSYLVKVDRPSATDLVAIWLIHLDRIDRRARRLEVLAPELVRAVNADRSAWIDEAFRTGPDEPSGIVRLARKAKMRRLHGDAVREIVRRAVDEKVMAQSECAWDLGPITPHDLERELEAYP